MAYAVNTHAIYFSLVDPSKLGPKARAAMQEAEAGRALLHLPSIVAAELYWLAAKRGRSDLVRKLLGNVLQTPCQFIPESLEAVHFLDLDNDVAVPEMHDRIIVGVARRLEVPLITKDEEITKSGLVDVIW